VAEYALEAVAELGLGLTDALPIRVAFEPGLELVQVCLQVFDGVLPFLVLFLLQRFP
jgi:hypothetical protein